MSSRFGAANPSKSRNAKLKILLACLSFFFVVLLCVLVWVLQNAKDGTAVQDVAIKQDSPVLVDPNSVGVWIPKYRVEKGTQIPEATFNELFRVDRFDRSQVPPGAITEDQRYLLVEKFAARMIKPNMPVLLEDVSSTPPLDTIDIPAGFRLITILVDNQSGVEGFAKPGTRVDVLWTFERETESKIKEKKIATIARFVKVVSVAGVTKVEEGNQRAKVEGKEKVTVSLLVTEENAQYIELARSTGQLSLVLVGGESAPPTESQMTTVVTMDTILKGPNSIEPVLATPADGTMYVDGKKYELRNGKWSLVLNDKQ